MHVHNFVHSVIGELVHNLANPARFVLFVNGIWHTLRIYLVVDVLVTFRTAELNWLFLHVDLC